VGAVLSLLGRKVTLAACNLATRHWLVSQADRLVRARKRLECELEKFIHIQPTYEKYARHYQGPGDRTQKPANPIQPKFSSRGDMNLRRLIEEVPSLLPSTKRYLQSSEMDWKGRYAARCAHWRWRCLVAVWATLHSFNTVRTKLKREMPQATSSDDFAGTIKGFVED
jgi:hypothetical protein